MTVSGLAQEMHSHVHARSDADDPSVINSGHLRAFVERIERLHTERKELADDISEIYAEAKGNGFDVKVIREVIKYRAQDRDKRAELDTLVELYLTALGDAQ